MWTCSFDRGIFPGCRGCGWKEGLGAEDVDGAKVVEVAEDIGGADLPELATLFPGFSSH